MAFDLSRSSASKKNVDFADARYQLSDQLKKEEIKNLRDTFTLYDNKEYQKTAVQDITAAYALSDKHLPIGEVLNKMMDFIIDLEDGVLNSEKDAIYAWKYSLALLELFDDKSKRQESLVAFDNSLKASIISSATFQEKFPGKYTNRTNFFDQAIKSSMIEDIINTFRDDTIPKIHDAAIAQSDNTAEHHNNPTLDRIVDWAVKQYNCHVDSFFQIKEDPETGLFYSVNTVIVHLKNGYDLSIVGYVGTDYDDKFSISVLDANQIAIKKHGEQLSSVDIQKTLEDTYESEAVPPLIELLEIEKRKNDILREQYDILTNTRPMVSAKALELKAAEGIVGNDYIWGCKTFRETHEDLPKNFKLSDLKLPEYKEKSVRLDEEQLNKQFTGFAEALNIVDDSTGGSTLKLNHPDALFQDRLQKQQNNSPFASTVNLNLLEQEQPKKDPTKIEKVKTDGYDLNATLLPGVVPVIPKSNEKVENSVTENAVSVPEKKEEPIFKPVEKALPVQPVDFKRPMVDEEQLSMPELVLPNLDEENTTHSIQKEEISQQDDTKVKSPDEKQEQTKPELDLDSLFG